MDSPGADKDYVPSSFALQCMEETERLERYFNPVPSPRRKKVPPRKKANLMVAATAATACSQLVIL